MATFPFQKVPQESIKPEGLKPGLRYAYYEGIFRSIYDFEHVAPELTGTIKGFSLDPCKRKEWIGLSLKGYVSVPSTGVYEFHVQANGV